MKEQFLLNKDITFLNHGSFGACPIPVFKEYQRLQLELEGNPVQFVFTKTPLLIKEAKIKFGKYIGCSEEDFYFTVNPTIAVNTIMRSLKLKAGDEILSTNHEYISMNKTWSFYFKNSGVKYVKQNITLPIQSKEQILEEFWKGYTKNTKVVFINHISSITALIFPVKEIIQKAKELGLITIIDGAHVPGHIDLNISDLDPDFYTGTLHKWMLTPKGCSFLYVNKKHQDYIDPLIISWGYDSETPSNNRFLDYHEYQGTRDVSAFLATTKAISFLEENKWKEKSIACKKIVKDNYKRFCDLLNTKPICPITDEFLVQMCSIPVNTLDMFALKKELFEKYKIEIPVMKLDDQVYIRFSINVYNSQDDLEVLYKALAAIKETTSLIS